ncbi:MAG: hypothetical protein Q4A06_03625, partial [Cardiobacteriaceae bacterium]|nr:hypothetical protein [Cardiobacteriaceae bacterium]
MAKQIVVTLAKIKDSPTNAEIINQYNIQSGSGAVRIQAVDDIYYHLTDVNTTFAPENIMAQRVGNDLHIAFEGENIANPDLVIENYYQLNPNGHKNLLIGMHENGSFYPYVPESAQTADAVHLLAEQVAAGQALGGESFAAIVPWVAGSAAMISPFAVIGGIAGLGLVGGVIAASSKNKDSDDTPAPPAQDPGTLTPPSQDPGITPPPPQDPGIT